MRFFFVYEQEVSHVGGERNNIIALSADIEQKTLRKEFRKESAVEAVRVT
jgi:hypothetical protein